MVTRTRLSDLTGVPTRTTNHTEAHKNVSLGCCNIGSRSSSIAISSITSMFARDVPRIRPVPAFSLLRETGNRGEAFDYNAKAGFEYRFAANSIIVPLFTLSHRLTAPRRKVDPWKSTRATSSRGRGVGEKNRSTRRVQLLIIVLIISVTQASVRVAPWLPASPLPSPELLAVSLVSVLSPCLTNFLPTRAASVRLLRR